MPREYESVHDKYCALHRERCTLVEKLRAVDAQLKPLNRAFRILRREQIKIERETGNRLAIVS